MSPYDPATARALLDRFGYRDRDGDGFRELPDGTAARHPLGLVHRRRRIGNSTTCGNASMRKVGIRMDFQVQTFPEDIKAAHAGQLQFSGFGWNGDIADDFMRLFYGPNAGAGNLARFRNAEFDALFEKSHRTPDLAERNRLYEAMTKIISAQAPWCTNVYRISNTVVAPRSAAIARTRTTSFHPGTTSTSTQHNKGRRRPKTPAAPLSSIQPSRSRGVPMPMMPAAPPHRGASRRRSTRLVERLLWVELRPATTKSLTFGVEGR